MKTLTVKEVFPTIQGEGSAAGTPAVFIRLSACNLWAGTEESRASGRGVCSQWCDTDFYGGQKIDPLSLAERIAIMTREWASPSVVITGGEPCLQLNKTAGQILIDQLKMRNISIHIETNGTINCDALDHADHVTVSPKRLKNSQLSSGDPFEHIVVRRGTDLKVVFPQWTISELQKMDLWPFKRKYLQPLDSGKANYLIENIYVARMIGWRISVQTHKLVGLP